MKQLPNTTRKSNWSEVIWEATVTFLENHFLMAVQDSYTSSNGEILNLHSAKWSLTRKSSKSYLLPRATPPEEVESTLQEDKVLLLKLSQSQRLC